MHIALERVYTNCRLSIYRSISLRKISVKLAIFFCNYSMLLRRTAHEKRAFRAVQLIIKTFYTLADLARTQDAVKFVGWGFHGKTMAAFFLGSEEHEATASYASLA